MREIRQSKRVEADALMRYETDTINEILNNSELKTKIEFALSTLAPVPKRRFLKHYSERLTYREIAKEENKAVSTIYESVMTARKKFLKNEKARSLRAFFIARFCKILQRYCAIRHKIMIFGL